MVVGNVRVSADLVHIVVNLGNPSLEKFLYRGYES